MQVSKMLYKPYWNQWCSDTLELTNGLAEALAAPYQATASPLSVTFERWFLELKVFALPLSPTPTLTPISSFFAGFGEKSALCAPLQVACPRKWRAEWGRR